MCATAACEAHLRVCVLVVQVNYSAWSAYAVRPSIHSAVINVCVRYITDPSPILACPQSPLPWSGLVRIGQDPPDPARSCPGSGLPDPARSCPPEPPILDRFDRSCNRARGGCGARSGWHRYHPNGEPVLYGWSGARERRGGCGVRSRMNCLSVCLPPWWGDVVLAEAGGVGACNS